MPDNNSFSVVEKIQAIYAITGELEELFPGRHFTPDGHLVGSIGEVLAAEEYGLELLPASAPVHDAVSQDGRLVQIKATQINRVSISSKPDYLLVLRIDNDGSFQEIFNGKGATVWNATGKMMKNGQRSISLFKLRSLMAQVPDEDKIKRGEVYA